MLGGAVRTSRPNQELDQTCEHDASLEWFVCKAGFVMFCPLCTSNMFVFSDGFRDFVDVL